MCVFPGKTNDGNSWQIAYYSPEHGKIQGNLLCVELPLAVCTEICCPADTHTAFCGSCSTLHLNQLVASANHSVRVLKGIPRILAKVQCRIQEMLTEYGCGCYPGSKFCQIYISARMCDWERKWYFGKVMAKPWDTEFMWKRSRIVESAPSPPLRLSLQPWVSLCVCSTPHQTGDWA